MENNLRYQFKLFDGKGKRMFWEMGCCPELVNKVCPHCGAHPMLERDIYHVISEYETNYQCPLCGYSFKPEEVLGVSNDDLTIETFSFDGERYTALEEENLSSVARGLKDAKGKKVRILVDEEHQVQDTMLRKNPNIEDYVVAATTPPGSIGISTIEPNNDNEIYLGNKCIICGNNVYEIDSMICKDCKDTIEFAKRLRNVVK